MQDFSKKMSIVLRDDLASWQLTNTVGHIAAYLGNKMSEPFDTGANFVSKDGINFARNSQFAVVVLSATTNELKKLATKLYNSDLCWIAYTQEMIDLIDDDELAQALSLVPADEMNILGIGVFADKDKLKELTGRLHLWK